MDKAVKRFLSEAGKIGGASKSAIKIKASIQNGKLGGRPRAAKTHLGKFEEKDQNKR